MDNLSVPVMDDPLGKHWDQPEDMVSVPVDKTHALLSQRQFDGLLDYSRSTPSGVYPGKCWKGRTINGQWYLAWFGEDPGNGMLACLFRDILILEQEEPTQIEAMRAALREAHGNGLDMNSMVFLMGQRALSRLEVDVHNLYARPLKSLEPPSTFHGIPIQKTKLSEGWQLVRKASV